MRRSSRRGLALAALATIAVLYSTPVASAGGDRPDTHAAKPLTYAIIGDTPYGQPQIDNFPNDVTEINADPDVRLVVADPARPFQKTMYGVTRDVPNLRRITVNGSTTPCHEWLKLSIDPRTVGIFSVERVPFHNQPGFDPALCPAS
jgi:hypothetical protein